jgi:hypothetical protein
MVTAARRSWRAVDQTRAMARLGPGAPSIARAHFNEDVGVVVAKDVAPAGDAAIGDDHDRRLQVPLTE